MGFKFNFSLGGDAAAADDENTINDDVMDTNTDGTHSQSLSIPATELDICAYVREVGEIEVISERLQFTTPNDPTHTITTLFRRNFRDVEIEVIEEDTGSGDQGAVLMRAISEKTDLLPGVYEGGMKTWECAMDLVQYLAEMNHSTPHYFDGKRVLEVIIMISSVFD